MDPIFSAENLVLPPKVAPGWMVTFADLLSLLLAFFVILFATSSVDQAQWQQRISPISAYLTGAASKPVVALSTSPVTRAAHSVSYILALVQQTIDSTAGLSGTTAALRDGAVWIDLPRQSDAEKMAALLGQFGRVLSALDNHVELLVEPNLPGSELGAQPSGWAAALALSTQLAAHLSRDSEGRPIAATAGGIGSGPATGRVSLLIIDRGGDGHVSDR